jgi:hypothetical protein
MKIFLLGTFFLVQPAFANFQACDHTILTNNADSRHLTVNVAEVLSNQYEMMDIQMALNTSNLMNKMSDCNTILDETNSETICSDAILKNHNICNVKTDYGFYIVYKDYVDTVHITFNRWD